jgi:transcriptional regulator with XRE-family HTH domain
MEDLKKFRRIAGLSQRELADKSGVDQTLISRLERGRRQTASYATVVRLARALNLEPHELEPVDFEIKAKPAPVVDAAAKTA